MCPSVMLAEVALAVTLTVTLAGCCQVASTCPAQSAVAGNAKRCACDGRGADTGPMPDVGDRAVAVGADRQVHGTAGHCSVSEGGTPLEVMHGRLLLLGRPRREPRLGGAPVFDRLPGGDADTCPSDRRGGREDLTVPSRRRPELWVVRLAGQYDDPVRAAVELAGRPRLDQRRHDAPGGHVDARRVDAAVGVVAGELLGPLPCRVAVGLDAEPAAEPVAGLVLETGSAQRHDVPAVVDGGDHVVSGRPELAPLEVTPAEVGVVAGHVVRTAVLAVAGEHDELALRRVVQRPQLTFRQHLPHPAVIARPHQLDEPGRRVLESGLRLALDGHREVGQLGDGLDRSAGCGTFDGRDFGAGAKGARRTPLLVDGRVVRPADTDQGGRAAVQGDRESAAARILERTPLVVDCIGRARRGKRRGGNSGHAESGQTAVHASTNPRDRRTAKTSHRTRSRNALPNFRAGSLRSRSCLKRSNIG